MTRTFTTDELKRALSIALDLYEDERSRYEQDPAPARALVIEATIESLAAWGDAPLFAAAKGKGRKS